ncbi:YraN family protein [Calycomorphotria hydatis]|uniref:UPF0102 protein V22_11730 n=1 Tax=Calycomorphotria hydatis TaxID=2528027 RepID=A0A517T6E4_9PLAN|nr:YraN family protein [Calycomorphotria hydatis]QDT63944.1 hypothetical protein V22_11730 [Calycomorphotria hydatis]
MLRGILNRWLGDRGERAAEKFLKRQGIRILHRQYRTKLGEIDLIGLQDGAYVFIEVKTRKSDAKGHPVEAITFQKRKQVTRVALNFLKRQRKLDHSARFDVVAILWPEGAKTPAIDYYPNAFPPTGVDGMYS